MSGGDAKALKEKATELYKQGQWASAVEAYEDARKAAASSTDVDVSALAVLHANKAAALLADGGRDVEAAKEGAMAVMLDEGYARARQRVGAACVRLGVPAVIELVQQAYANLDGLYAFHRDVRRGIQGGDAKLLRALGQVDTARVAGNDAFAKGAHGEAALAYTAGLAPDPYNPYGDNRTADGKHDYSPIVGGAVLLCNRAAAHASLGRHEEALSDAVDALAADDTYVKARSRQCEALIQLGRGREALAVVARLEKEGAGGAGDAARVESVRRRAREAAKTEKRAANADLIERAERVELPPEYAAWAAEKGGGRTGGGGARRGGGGGGGKSSKSSSKKRKKAEDNDSDGDGDGASSSSSSSSSSTSRDRKKKRQTEEAKKTEKKSSKKSKSKSKDGKRRKKAKR